MQKSYLINQIENINYDDIDHWKNPNTSFFSENKTLYSYQVNALENAAKALYIYFSHTKGKKQLNDLYLECGMKENHFSVLKYTTKFQKKNNLINDRYKLLEQYYKSENNKIPGRNFLNRIAFWMATGSGKSIVIVKLIEYLDYLQKEKLIPKKDIMLLVPRQDLIEQIKKEIKEYNINHERSIRLSNLKYYEDDKNTPSLLKNSEITVYYYRSDLIRDERKESLLDFADYDNNGDWYIVLDEAHRGETGTSLLQDYVSIMSRNGFLFNFSATFTDQIDYATTCFNFNLEKFINEGYGKKIYLSTSRFNFKGSGDDLNEIEKQKQVLKSMINLTLIKKSRKDKYYHNPLMVTLVNSVNIEDSDLMMFFKKLEEISNGTVSGHLFLKAKEELILDFRNEEYLIGSGNIEISASQIKKITLEDVLETVYNSNTFGRIEILEGESGKELALKLETSEKPFALIKIGDTDKFQREKLGPNYFVSSSYYNKSYFKNLDKDDGINILLGSRSFYEGWDSNRPNVINFINIGGGEAKKFVLQAIGRGVRIEPEKGYRLRLLSKDKNKNQLLETLFLFATDRAGLLSVISTIEEQKDVREIDIKLEKTDIYFDLLIPHFKKSEETNIVSHFQASQENINNFKLYFLSFDKPLLILKKNLSPTNYDLIKQRIISNTLFQTNNDKNYYNYEQLLDGVISHISYINKEVDKIKLLDNEIIHFEHIKVVQDLSSANITDLEINELTETIKNIKKYDEDLINKKIHKLMKNDDQKALKRFIQSLPKSESLVKDLKIMKLANHYYYPLIISLKEKIDYMKNIITVESEVKFINSLALYLKNAELNFDWMFSKINEHLDDVFIPYFSKNHNKERKFFPDFIFWMKQDNDYKIIFIDPKGSSHVDYIYKLEEFERLFFTDGQPNKYVFENYTVTVDLKMITNNIDKIPKKYQRFWVTYDGFESWMSF